MACLQVAELASTLEAIAREVFSTMLNINVDRVVIQRETDADGPACDGVVSFIGLSGVRAGMGSLRCTEAVACRLASCFLLSEYSHMSDDVADVVGELTNMIFGNVKDRLAESLGSMSISIPTVIHGARVTARNLGSHNWTVVSLVWSAGQLDVRLCFAPARETSGESCIQPKFSKVYSNE